MTTAVAAAAAAAVFALLGLLVTVQARRRSERALASALSAIEEHGRIVSQILERVTLRAAAARSHGVSELDLGVDLPELAARTAEEVVRRAGAPAAAVLLEDPEGDAVTAARGIEGAAGLLERIPLPPVAHPFRSLAVNWWNGPAPEGQDRRAYRSALVVPVVANGLRCGVIVACTVENGPFDPETADTLDELAREVERVLPTRLLLTRLARRAPATSEDRS